LEGSAVILLDTHVLAWLVAQPEKLSRRAASAIRRARASDGLAISDITLWELAFLFFGGFSVRTERWKTQFRLF
jgi:PIN domain nuclease of toxin-antitoxin system